MLAEVGRLSLDTPNGLTEVEVDLNLAVDQISRQVAERRLIEGRERQLRQVGELEWLKFLRDEVLVDPAIARLWWMRQQPELVAAIGDGHFHEALEMAVAQHSLPGQVGHNDVFHILTEFAKWLDSGDARAEAALSILDKLLDLFGQDELRSRLANRNAGATGAAGRSTQESNHLHDSAHP